MTVDRVVVEVTRWAVDRVVDVIADPVVEVVGGSVVDGMAVEVVVDVPGFPVPWLTTIG